MLLQGLAQTPSSETPDATINSLRSRTAGFPG